MTNKQVYEQLTESNVHWFRIDSNHIGVWTPGYKDNSSRVIEFLLLKAKMRAVKQEFDRICGKTLTVYRHK